MEKLINKERLERYR